MPGSALVRLLLACALLPRAVRVRVQAVRLERGACPEGWLMCPGDQRCLRREFLCDGNADCLNALDESPPQCNGTCRPGAFFCGPRAAPSVGHVRAAVGRCHKDWRRCDTRQDCADGSDELGCPTPDKRLLFRCDRGRVVQSRNVRCDGYLTDCRDGTDEQLCASACPSNTTFFCDGFCRPMARWCDKKRDCSDDSDEASCDFTFTTTLTTSTATSTTSNATSTTSTATPTTSTTTSTSSTTTSTTSTATSTTSTTTSTSSSTNASLPPSSLPTPTRATFSSEAVGGHVVVVSSPPMQELPQVGVNDTKAASDADGTGGGVIHVVLYAVSALALALLALSLLLASRASFWRQKRYWPAREEAELVTSNALYFDDLSDSSCHLTGPLLSVDSRRERKS